MIKESELLFLMLNFLSCSRSITHDIGTQGRHHTRIILNMDYILVKNTNFHYNLIQTKEGITESKVSHVLVFVKWLIKSHGQQAFLKWKLQSRWLIVQDTLAKLLDMKQKYWWVLMLIYLEPLSFTGGGSGPPTLYKRPMLTVIGSDCKRNRVCSSSSQ